MDEVSARTAAKLMGLTPRGTLYVLLKALELKEFNLNDFLDTLSELVKHGFRLKEEVYLEAVKKAREIAKETGK
jgi:predicted nucleic acid-binding protein